MDRWVRGRSNGRTKPLDNSDRDVLLRRVMGQLLMMSSIPRSEAELPEDLGWGSCLQIYLQFWSNVYFYSSGCQVMKLTAKLFQILHVLCEVPMSSPHGSRSSILAIWLPPLPTLSGQILFCPLSCSPGFPRDGFLAHSRLSLKPHSQYGDSGGAALSPVCVPSVPFRQLMWSGQYPYLAPGPVTPGLSSLISSPAL